VTGGQRVLVVEGLAETEQVLRAVLEPRGLHVNRVRAMHSAHDEQRGETPRAAVLVIDADEPSAGDLAAWDGAPRVILGTTSVPAWTAASDHFLQKPFHYGELIAAIERLLSGVAA
jgi:DNA-binding response OmpR family regulator